MPHADQSYEVDGVSIKARIEPGHEYIRIEGGAERFVLGCFGRDPAMSNAAAVEFFTMRVPSMKTKRVEKQPFAGFGGCVVYNGVPITLQNTSEATDISFTLPWSVSGEIVGSYTYQGQDTITRCVVAGTALGTEFQTTHSSAPHIRYPVPASITTQAVVWARTGADTRTLSYSFTEGFVVSQVEYDDRFALGWKRDLYVGGSTGGPVGNMSPGSATFTPYGVPRVDYPPMTSAQNLSGYNEALGTYNSRTSAVLWASSLSKSAIPTKVTDPGHYFIEPRRFMGYAASSFTASVVFSSGGFDPVTGKVQHTVFKNTVFTFCDDVETPNVFLNQRNRATGGLTGLNVMIPNDLSFNTTTLAPASNMSVRLGRHGFVHVGKSYALFEWNAAGGTRMIGCLKHGLRNFSAQINADDTAVVPRSINYADITAEKVYVVAADGYDVRKL